MAERVPLRLDALPPELLLKVIAHLTPRAVAQLSAANRSLYQITQTESIWRHIVLSIHRLDCGFVLPSTDALRACGGWREQAAFLLPNAKHLGYWASSQPYSSRILRVRTKYKTSTTTHPQQCALEIVAEQLVPSNLLDNPDYDPDPPLLLPNAAIPEGATPRSGFSLPRTGPGSHSPEAGLHVELLHEQFSWAPVFVITPDRGARLPNDNATGPGSLRLRLERSRREVGSLAELERESDEDEASERRSRSAAMMSLFAGRPPKRAWPTVHLYGGEAILPPGAVSEVNTNQVRFKGAMRGIHDALDGTTRPVVEHVPLPPREPPSPTWPGADFDDSNRFKSHCDGFHIVAVRAVSNSSPGTPSSSRSPNGVTGHRTPVPGSERRLGVGRDGGPAILWQGRERDPEEDRPRVTILRAGGGQDAIGGLIFRLAHSLDRSRDQVQEDGGEMLEEVVRTEREDFFPIVSPATQLKFDDPPATDSQGDILVASLEGLWVGTYGQAHGLEVGHITVKLALEHYTTTSHDGQEQRRTRLTRALSFVKVTGDQNVGSGQVSWTAVLDPEELDSAGDAPPTAEIDLGTIPSVTNEELVRWANLNPDDPGAERPRWEAGSVAGAGQIALIGFVHRSWTGAIVTFIRSQKMVRNEKVSYGEMGEEMEGEEKVVEVVDEIRVRWSELGCVSVFKRVRI